MRKSVSLSGQEVLSPDHDTDSVAPDDIELITDAPCIAAESIRNIQAPSPIQYNQANIASSPAPLTWARTPIKEVKYNIHIKAMMDSDPAFSAWVRSMVMVHSDNGAFETTCTVPDQWSDSVEQINIITAGKSLEKNRLLESLPGHYIHVMIGVSKDLN